LSRKAKAKDLDSKAKDKDLDFGLKYQGQGLTSLELDRFVLFCAFQTGAVRRVPSVTALDIVFCEFSQF